MFGILVPSTLETTTFYWIDLFKVFEAILQIYGVEPRLDMSLDEARPYVARAAKDGLLIHIEQMELQEVELRIQEHNRRVRSLRR